MQNRLIITTGSTQETEALADRLGQGLGGGEVLELAGDVGSGKTTFVRGLARGLESEDNVASPTFVLYKVYGGRAVELYHFDFYRLDDPGVMREALAEAIGQKQAAVAVEWSDIVQNVLPEERLQVRLEPTGEDSRRLTFRARGPKHTKLLKELS